MKGMEHETKSDPAVQGKFTYDFPRPMVTVDAVVFGVAEEDLHILLIERRRDPFQGLWALPGGFIDMDEDLEASVRRELAEETGVTGIRFEQLGAYGTPGRDPRGRTISIAYMALVNRDSHVPRGGDDAADARWFALHKLPQLAFDHASIVHDATAALRAKTRHAGVGGQVLDAPFALESLRTLYETIRGVRLEASQFHREVADLAVVDPVSDPGGAGGRMYRFNPARLAEL
jgi:8-oxo-dGTP diphosphatase